MNCKTILLLLFLVLILGPGWLKGAPADSKEVLCEKNAMSMGQEGKLDEALSAIRQCIKDSPTRAKTYTVLGYLLLEKGDEKEAMAAFEKALELRPRSSAAKTGKGIILSRAGDLKAAELILKDALKLNPAPARTYYELGVIYQQLGDEQQALTSFKEGISSYEQNTR